jgi:hypothetical protein
MEGKVWLEYRPDKMLPSSHASVVWGVAQSTDMDPADAVDSAG